ncbi:PEP-CTERM sorting domain-containing protein [Alkalimarinus sediminis]|uniref:PEP-CTERM sorting domain-containing protein n=1 Tax=Alkalimarinus sediminis TaxID=1632866 RepID=A0A9E8HLM9_9ALTE|nr:PEP-CTERM sorting domain-containing protein [Alkalimarinus sediminis]UZW74973.1 PEP-CTERM sorting domain-containing protein [Alkalimarinus sediminis]
MFSKVVSKISILFCASIFAAASQAAVIDIDLSGAATGTSIVAPGASFATSFAGQSVSGNVLSGNPTGPLSLAPSGSLTVNYWNPSCVGCNSGNSILPQPGNLAPLSVLLDSAADSFELVMGSSVNGSSVQVDFFDSMGAIVNSITQVYSYGYNKYSFGGFGLFSGISFHSNNDPSGVRYMDMSYNAVASSVPESGSLALLSLGLVGLAIARRRAKS